MDDVRIFVEWKSGAYLNSIGSGEFEESLKELVAQAYLYDARVAGCHSRYENSSGQVGKVGWRLGGGE